MLNFLCTNIVTQYAITMLNKMQSTMALHLKYGYKIIKDKIMKIHFGTKRSSVTML